MEWVACVMIVLIALGAYLGWRVLTNSVDSDGPGGSIGGGSGRSVFTDSDHPDLGKKKDAPGRAIGGSI